MLRWEIHTQDIEGISWTGETARVILHNVLGLVDALDGAGFYVELVIAEALLSIVRSVLTLLPSVMLRFRD